MNKSHSFYQLLLLVPAFFLFFHTNGFARVSNDVVWRTVNDVYMPIPPKTHPRLCIRQEDLPDVKMRMTDPALKKVWNDLQKMRDDWKPDQIPSKIDFRFYFQHKGAPDRAQLEALNYLLTNNMQSGRYAITTMLDTLERAKFPDIGDVSRAYGLMMFSGAMVYDWCYPLLTQKEKERYVAAFIKLAKQLECGYPPIHDSSVAGHGSEWMISRDMLAAGIAIYDEYPEMYHLAAARFFGAMVPARNWFYPGHNYHQGSSYLNVRFSNDLIALWLFDKMGAGNVFNPEQQYVLYDVIYRRRPDGQVLPAGDVTPSAAKGVDYSLPAFLASSYYKDEYLNYEFNRKPNVEAHCKILEFLWRDTRLGSRKPDDLPLTRYSGSPFGWMIARTGWDDESVIAEMKINEYNFNNHQHLDAGSFQLYYKGPLAIDAGAYQGSSGGYNSPHCKNYFKRTIAHNSLLIFDPGEQFACSGYGGNDKTDKADNDGGQRFPGNNWGAVNNLDQLLHSNFRTGNILAAGYGPDLSAPDYSYLKGDITDAYSSKVKEVKRSFVFLNLHNQDTPAALIVFDKIVSTDASFKKIWLLHSIEQPEVKGSQITVRRTRDGDSGILTDTVLLPDTSDVALQAVGGPGKEFWVFGKNYPNDVPGDTRNERGAWRVEVSPKKAAGEDYYLNVMQTTGKSNAKILQVTRIDGKAIVGVRIADRMVTFSKNAELITDSFELKLTTEKTIRLLITDLQPGNWQVIKNGRIEIRDAEVKKGESVLSFNGTGGLYKFIRLPSNLH
jgi:heparin/heparan-sulfate lyase